MEDAGEDVTDMDGPGAVRAAIAMIEDPCDRRLSLILDVTKITRS